MRIRIKARDSEFSRYIINPEANLEIARILDYLLKVYHDHGWNFIEEKHQCSFMCNNFYNLVKKVEPELFEELKVKYPPGLQVAHDIFRAGEKGNSRMIHSWIKLGPVILDPTYKQFLKKDRKDKFDDMVKRYKQNPFVKNPDDLKLNDNDIKSGKEIAKYIRDLTSDPEMVVDNWIHQFVKPHKWELKTISMNEVLKDPAFKESWKWIKTEEDLRYNEEAEELNYSHYDQPIVLYQDNKETLLIDGYSRSERHLWNGEDTIKAYVNIKE